MRFGFGRGDWYDIIIFGLAAMIVYPDKVLDWIGEHSGRTFRLIDVIIFEIAAIAVLFLAMAFLMSLYPRLDWWYPLIPLGMLASFRLIARFISDLFGFRDL